MSDENYEIACNDSECDYFEDGLSEDEAESMQYSECPKCQEWGRDGELVIVR